MLLQRVSVAGPLFYQQITLNWKGSLAAMDRTTDKAELADLCSHLNQRVNHLTTLPYFTKSQEILTFMNLTVKILWLKLRTHKTF